jgi:hypothetical protein
LCYMPCPSHPPLLDRSNYTWRRVQVMKLPIMQFSPTSCHFISLRSKYSPQHHILKHPQSMIRNRKTFQGANKPWITLQLCKTNVITLGPDVGEQNCASVSDGVIFQMWKEPNNKLNEQLPLAEIVWSWSIDAQLTPSEFVLFTY